MIEWSDLRLLVVIARAGSLTAAARELGVEHSTVGRRLSAVEAALGARMFTRGPEGLTPTENLVDVMPALEAVARDISAIERRLAGADRRVEGAVRLGAAEGFVAYLASNLFLLRERHPAVRLEFVSTLRELDPMRSEIELAIRVDEATRPDLISKRLVKAGWGLYATPSYLERRPVDPASDSLAGHDVIAFEDALADRAGGRWLESRLAGATVVMRCNSLASAQNAAAGGLGLTALTCMHGDVDARLRRARPELIGTNDVYLVVHPDVAKVARVRAAMDFVIELFERDRTTMEGIVADAT